MREIKFRAWDKEFKEIKHDITPDVVVFYGSLNKCLENTELMQFTGLKDKNGKDIYEGDIVKMDEEARVSPNKNLVVEHDDFSVLWLRPTDDRFYIARLDEGCADHLGNYKQKHGLSGEVIGNIYENPELL